MTITEKALKRKVQYAQWLAEQLDELCISQSELASAVVKSQINLLTRLRKLWNMWTYGTMKRQKRYNTRVVYCRQVHVLS